MLLVWCTSSLQTNFESFSNKTSKHMSRQQSMWEYVGSTKKENRTHILCFLDCFRLENRVRGSMWTLPRANGVNFYVCLLQPVPEKMRLEMVIGMQTEILDGLPRSLFERLIWKETRTLTIEDFDLHFDVHFESHLLGNGLYWFSSSLEDSTTNATCDENHELPNNNVGFITVQQML